MSDVWNGPGWGIASEGKWYPPHLHPSQTFDRSAGGAFVPPETPEAIPGSSTQPAARRKGHRRPVIIGAGAVAAVALVGGVLASTLGSGSNADAAIISAV